MMKKNSMTTSLLFLSSLFIILCFTQATNAIHFRSASNMSNADATMSTPPTPDDPPRGCQNLTGRDTRDPLLNVPWNWRPDYAKNDPCWTPQDDKNCTVAEHLFNPGREFESYTFTCLDCTFHMQSGPSGSSSYYYCNNK
ncbi:hypothetical protein POM88_051447 [Heracleum sosnowskyi]|uniref:Uncharacterized protein n=1 Tax=Heracleum sosnowskyi TaxID=360622 RepID=A0AAD8H0H2_9APIA|nr:hypothetical protein POM88_051447 [Heracleum sosnowskyi]